MNNQTKVEKQRKHLERSLNTPDDTTKLMLLYKELNVSNFNDAMFMVDVLQSGVRNLTNALDRHRKK